MDTDYTKMVNTAIIQNVGINYVPRKVNIGVIEWPSSKYKLVFLVIASACDIIIILRTKICIKMLVIIKNTHL